MKYLYNDENLMDAGENPKYKNHSINEIAEHFPELPVIDVWVNPKMGFLKIATYDHANWLFDNGVISSLQWDAYRAIYRNLTPRFSNLASSFEF